MKKELITLLGNNEVGVVRRDSRGRLAFEYADNWQRSGNAYPLSISMPLAATQHPHAKIEPFLWNLLPDNKVILDRWGSRFHVSPGNAFALMGAVGEDCAGAVRFVHPDRLGDVPREGDGNVEWLDEAAVEARLQALREDISAWRRMGDSGQFSLAGAQPKTALLFDGQRWGLPSGRMPTTHILKPAMAGLDGHAENEHFCLSLARSLQLVAAITSVARFGSEVALVVERYDRLKIHTDIQRVHQEDFCQALAVPPTTKYENEGGPGAVAIANVLRENSGSADADIRSLVDALAYNWLIAGTDAHGKNYSVLIGASGRVRLAPLYDVASALPYDDMYFPKLKLAMKIGGEYRLRSVGLHQWRTLARQLKLDQDEIVGRVGRLAAAMPDLALQCLERCTQQKLNHPLLPRLADRICQRARECARILTTSSSGGDSGG
ncbi:MAG: type II toxin-antitoxin system HipA family toxin [Deltaproteobacteria bacterium]|nr:type II toxin-antitoxin system HipA family toxin [Deltaproteobacteria bacterium]